MLILYALFCFLWGPQPGMPRSHSWLCVQISLLAVLMGPYEKPGIQLSSATCKANTSLLCYGSSPHLICFKKKKRKIEGWGSPWSQKKQ